MSTAANAVLFCEARVSSQLMDVSAARIAFRVIVVLLFTISFQMLATRYSMKLRIAAVAHVGLTWLLIAAFTQPVEYGYLLVTINLIPLATYERFPENLVQCAVFLVPTILLEWWFWRADALSIVTLVITTLLAAAFGILMTRYRETTISLQKYTNRLEENVTSLTRANSLSQDYARVIEEQSREAERLKLARDIHDIVGYTLTNNIMMMEAVKVMSRSEPERIPHYVESLRHHTEEGLASIKTMLASFRSAQRPRETIGSGIVKLVHVFTLSTGLQVQYEFGNTSWELFEPYAETVYHFVQEGLINAFRHGRASRVTLIFWDYGTELRITVSDDGVGSPDSIAEGIGIQGMRERARDEGGRVVIDRTMPGFRISICLPSTAHESV